MPSMTTRAVFGLKEAMLVEAMMSPICIIHATQAHASTKKANCEGSVVQESPP